jgi:hypothetical protein
MNMQEQTQPAADVARIAAALAAPFNPSEVRFKPGAVSGNRALALAFIDARVIRDRLDSVLGVGGWQDSYRVLPSGAVMCRLRCRIGGEWVSRTDVGGPSEQPDAGDRVKAAFSDALKRAAVKFGVGRYLYRLPAQWCDWDAQRRQFVKPPMLPPWALPASRTAANGTATAGKPLAANGKAASAYSCLGRRLALVGQTSSCWTFRPRRHDTCAILSKHVAE